MAEGLTSQANPLPDDDLVAEYLNAKAQPIRAGQTRGQALDYRFEKGCSPGRIKKACPGRSWSTGDYNRLANEIAAP